MRGRGRLRVVTSARLAGVAAMLAASVAVNWLATAEELRLDPASIEVSGIRYTERQEVLGRLGLAPGEQPNVVRLRTADMAAAIAALPAVRSVDVVVALPNRLAVRVAERAPLFGWRTRDRALLVDADGTLLAEVGSLPAELPVVDDRRAATQAVGAGERLDEVDLAAVVRLAAITPSSLGSASTELRLSVDDSDGFVLSSAQPEWRAIFGPYTANLRRPQDNIDRQVQCLRSLLAQGEAAVAVVYLSVSDDRCGTVRERPTPEADIFQNVVRQPTLAELA